MNQLNLNENTSNYGPTINSLYNTLNTAYNDDLMTLVKGLNGFQMADIGQTLPTSVQHTCGMNHLTSLATTSDCFTTHHIVKKVPKDYMCHLCFNKDHFIRDCPLVSFVLFSIYLLYQLQRDLLTLAARAWLRQLFNFQNNLHFIFYFQEYFSTKFYQMVHNFLIYYHQVDRVCFLFSENFL